MISKMKEALKKLFDPRYADKKVEAIQAQSQETLDNAALAFDKLKKKVVDDGDTGMIMYIAAGGKDKK